MAWKDTEKGSARTAASSEMPSGTGINMESCAASCSAQAPGAPVVTPTCTPGPRSPLVKLQHRLRSPAWQGGQGGSMPRGPQVSQGFSTTRWPTSSPRASGPSAVTSATTSCPGTWGSDEKAAIGLSMSPVLKSPSTSLASEPQTPERMGRVTTQSGRTRRASSTSCRPKGMPASIASNSSCRRRPDLVLGGRHAKEQCLHEPALSAALSAAPPARARIPSMKPSMSDVLNSMTPFMSGR